VPHYLVEAKDLVVLKVSANEITDLHKETFEHLPLLQLLDLSENHLKVSFKFHLSPFCVQPLTFFCRLPQAIPSWFPIMINIISLDLSHNPLGDADMTPIFQLPLLTRVNLSHTSCFLSGIKPSDKCARKLEELDLSENDMTKIPPSLFAFKALKVLNLANNKVCATFLFLSFFLSFLSTLTIRAKKKNTFAIADRRCPPRGNWRQVPGDGLH